MHTRIVLVVLATLLTLPLAGGQPAVAAKTKRTTITRTFSNTTPMVIIALDVDESMTADPYPSAITVADLKQGRIRDVNVRLHNFTHFYPDDVQVLLVGPGGQTAILMAKAGGSGDATGVTLRLDDEAAAPLPDQDDLQSGAFRPTNVTNSVIDFIDLDPDPSASAALSVFDGSDPNGTWRLYVQDEYAPTDPGAIAGGWSLEITAQVTTKKKKR